MPDRTAIASPHRLSITEYAVLGLLSERPSHGFALSKQLDAGGGVGRVLTVRRPLVYRALDRLVAAGLAEPIATEKGDAGPHRVIHRVTPAGRRAIEQWLTEPVEHVRDLRIDFLLKLALLERRGESPLDLIRTQRMALAPTLAALDTPGGEDHVEMWRRHSATAAGAYLDDLEDRHSREDRGG